MARTPDRRPGESDEEGIVLENRASGDNPSVAGGIRFVNGSFSFRDSLGLFNPRNQLSAAGDESDIQFNSLGFLSASADLRFIGSQRALVVPALSGSLTRLSDGSPYMLAGSNVALTTGSNGAITINAVGASGGESLLDGGGTPNYLARWSDTNTLIDSIIYDGGTSIGIGTLAGGDILAVSGSTSLTGSLLPGLDSSFSLGSTGKRWLAFLDDLNSSGVSTFGGNLLPDISSNYDIGIPGNIWRNIHAISLSGSLTGSGLQRGSIVFAGSTGGLTGSVSQIFWDDSNSRLGIGTSSPDSPLEVFGVSGSLFSVTEGLSGSLFSVCGVSGVPIFEVFSDVRLTAGGGWASPALTVTGSRVGIGTSAPVDALSVVGTLGLTGSLLPGSTGTVGSPTRPWNTLYGTALSGSLTRLMDGSSYLVAGAGISITTGSNGAITIVNDGTVGDISEITPGLGLTGGGTSGTVSLAVDNSLVATLSGSTFTGAVTFNGGLSGSLTRLSNGSPYLVAGTNVIITTGSNGAITIDAALSPYTTASFTNVTEITVNHTLGLSLYDIEVFDSNREKMIPKSAVATSPTRADISFSIPTSGYVIVGGPGALGGSGGGSGGGDLTSLTTNISTTGEITGSTIHLTGGTQEVIRPTVGSAPYFGLRAWANVYTANTSTCSFNGYNISSISLVSAGQWDITFSTAGYANTDSLSIMPMNGDLSYNINWIYDKANSDTSKIRIRCISGDGSLYTASAFLISVVW